MTITVNQPKEEKIKDFKTKEVFYYIDKKKRIKVKSREIYKNGKKFVHFPFYKDGSPKYDKCKKITYIGYEGSDSLPRGFLKKFTKGYGFTKIYSRIIYPLIRDHEISEIIIQENIPNKIEEGKLFLNPIELDRHYPSIQSLIDQHKDELDLLVNKVLSDLLSSTYKTTPKKYIPNSISNYIKRTISKDTVLSDSDVQSLFELISFVSHESAVENSKNILKTKTKIEEHFIEEVINEFKELLITQKTDTRALESKWQQFFKKYSWIFSQLFSFPVLIFEDEAFVGGKNIQNKGGKFADFIYRNKLTNNIVFIEIKTHNTSILNKGAYRGDDVYSISKSLSGGLNQVLNQKENFQHEFYSLKVKNKNEEFESYNPKCLIVIGQVSKLTPEKIEAFELIRSNSKDVEIITFDEVLEKIKGLQSIMTNSDLTES